MSFNLKLFILIFIIVSTTMLLSYLYGIRVVEDDRRNFINEYLENRAVILNQRVSSAIEGIRFLSRTLCQTTESLSSNTKEMEKSLRQDLLRRRGLKGIYFTRGDVVIKYNMDEDEVESYKDGRIEIKDKLIIISDRQGDCVFYSKFSIEELLGEKEMFENVLMVFKDITYRGSGISDNTLKALGDRINELAKNSSSGVFIQDDNVVGYSIDDANEIKTLFLVNRKRFEDAIVSLRYRILFAGFVTLVLFLFIAFLISGKITKPLKLLRDKAQLIKNGKFEKIDVERSSDEIGEAVEAFNTMVDDLRTKEENLKESQMKLIQAEKMSAFGQLSAGIAHEVKNPLTSVLGYIQLSRRLMKDEKIDEYLKIAESETLRCKQILEDLLKFARMDRHQKSTLDLVEVVNNTIRLINHQLMLKKIKITFKCDGKIEIMGNANQLQQVILNILLNAMQSIERKGEGNGLIEVYLLREDGFGVVGIKDNGEGIKEEHLQKIFEPFFTTKGDSGGTGLGLSISYGIVREHNGEIKVKSIYGEGSEFRIYLPCC